METTNAPAPYVCKHECERNKLKDMIFQQGQNAATAAKEYSANMEAARQALAARDAEIAALREALQRINVACSGWNSATQGCNAAAKARDIARAALSERQP